MFNRWLLTTTTAAVLAFSALSVQAETPAQGGEIVVTYKDDITRELDALASTSQVENELAAMKAQLSLGAAPQAAAPALGAGSGAKAPAAAAQIEDADVVEEASVEEASAEERA